MNTLRKTLLLTLASSFLTLTAFDAPALADDVVSFGTGGYATALRTKDMMHKMDTNSDGMLSKDEWTSFQQKMFDALDKDKSDFIDEKEFTATEHENFAFATAAYARGLMTKDMFMKIDANGDGKISREEFLAYHRKIFDMLDKQKKGMVGLVDFIRPGGV
jgi:Ca2+-binding EF-hand superfamily protein